MATAASGQQTVGATSSLHDRLLDAAWELTCTAGWSEVTMSKLAASTGVSRQTVYNELGSKPRIGQALVLAELDSFLAVVAAELDGNDDLVEAIRSAAEKLLRMARDNPLLHAVLSSAHSGTNELLPLLTTQAEPVIGAATAVIKERVVERYPDLGLSEHELDVALDSIVRLVLSQVMQPGKPPVDTAADVAWIAARVLGR
jgi:AcrR family transcriptional regulator